MIYNTMTLANAVLELITFIHDDQREYVLQGFNVRGLCESGYTLISNKSARAVAFAQSSGGDGLVVYVAGRWDMPLMKAKELEDIGEYFNCDDLFNAAQSILEYLDEER